jgi:hypothetical protein
MTRNKAALCLSMIAVGLSQTVLAQESTLTFSADFQTRVTGSLEAGTTARITYDANRLTACRGTRSGREAWSIQASYRIAGGPIRSVVVAGAVPAPDQANLPLVLDRAGELEIWFENTSLFGCQAWDSANGRNYRFTVAPASSGPAVAQFKADWSFTVSGQPRQTKTLTLEYDSARLPSCRGSRFGSPAWNILAWAKWPSGRQEYVPVVLGGTPVAGASLDLVEAGEVQLWFEAQDPYGCREWDSAYQRNYRIAVTADPRAPGWVGNAASVTSRATCDNGGPCESDRVQLDFGFRYDTGTRERAAIRSLYFDVWKAGTTDFNNPNLWNELDVRVYYRWSASGPFQMKYANFSKRVGNNARYELSLREIDPLNTSFAISDPAQCPATELLLSGDPNGQYVGANVEYYIWVNGVTLRAAGGRNFNSVYENYKGLFSVCLPRQP